MDGASNTECDKSSGMLFQVIDPNADNKIVASGAEFLVNELARGGVRFAFTVPGESFLGVLDALRDRTDIRTIATRHEGAAGFMAEAAGKLSGRPGLCMATRMVGAANMAIGLHTAMQDSSPLIAILGQVPTDKRGREAFQEADLVSIFSPMVKWAVEPARPDLLAEIAHKAVRVATQGRPGPVVISLPEDILSMECTVTSSLRQSMPQPVEAPAGVVRQILERLRLAKNPIIIVGAGVLASGATDAVVEFAEREKIGVLAGWRRPDAFPNDHGCYLGHTGLRASPTVRKSLTEADTVLIVGHRLDENTALGYSFPGFETELIIVDTAVESMMIPSGVDLMAVADALSFFNALNRAADASKLDEDTVAGRQQLLKTRHDEWVEETTPVHGSASESYADLTSITRHIHKLAPEATIYTSDAGTFSGWLDRYVRFNRPGTFLGPISGAMGYAVPAAIAAKLHKPEQPVVSFSGDGGFLMTGAEIETAVREQTPIVALVFDNQKYATIEVHQERHYPGRPIATGLGPVDFAEFASSLGGRGYTIRHESEFPDAFADALKSDEPCVLDIKTDPEQISVNDDVIPQ